VFTIVMAIRVSDHHRVGRAYIVDSLKTATEIENYNMILYCLRCFTLTSVRDRFPPSIKYEKSLPLKNILRSTCPLRTVLCSVRGIDWFHCKTHNIFYDERYFFFLLTYLFYIDNSLYMVALGKNVVSRISPVIFVSIDRSSAAMSVRYLYLYYIVICC